MREVLLKLGLIVVSLCAVLLAVEIGLRVLGRYKPPDLPKPARPDLYVPDERVGYHLWPSTRTCLRYPSDRGRVLEVNSNSDGFRSSRELGEADPRPRILLTGDSFVQGSGVEEGDRMSEVLERLEPGWRVDVLGVTGWGADMMLRAVEAYQEKAQPDVVVMAIYSGDFRRVARDYQGNGYALPKFGLRGGALVEQPPLLYEGLRRSRLAYLISNAWGGRDPNYFALHEALLQRFARDGEAMGFQPAVMFLPGERAGEEEQRDFLANVSAKNGMPYLDLTEPIHEVGADESYIPGNFHWSETGHAIAGREMHRWMRDEIGLAPLEGSDPAIVARSGDLPSRCHDAAHESLDASVPGPPPARRAVRPGAP